VRLSWKFLRLALLAALPLAMAGCSGINASHSVSPLDFFLPGLLKNECPTNAPTLNPDMSIQIATLR